MLEKVKQIREKLLNAVNEISDEDIEKVAGGVFAGGPTDLDDLKQSGNDFIYDITKLFVNKLNIGHKLERTGDDLKRYRNRGNK